MNDHFVQRNEEEFDLSVNKSKNNKITRNILSYWQRKNSLLEFLLHLDWPAMRSTYI